MILTQAQAEALAYVMATLFNVGGRFEQIRMPSATIQMQGTDIIIYTQGRGLVEEFANESQFAAAYGLQ